jgi:hypothetical protein
VGISVTESQPIKRASGAEAGADLTEPDRGAACTGVGRAAWMSRDAIINREKSRGRIDGRIVAGMLPSKTVLTLDIMIKRLPELETSLL